VNIPINNTNNEGLFWLYRIIKYTPAVTSVEECTKAETGVGAAIAAGSQAQNGIWALFVILVSISSNINNLNLGVLFIILFQLPVIVSNDILIIIKLSPTRLERTVIIPALLEFWFW